MPHRFAFKKSDAPAVAVVVGDAAPLRKPTEAECHIGGRIAVHPQQLAHALALHFGVEVQSAALANAGFVLGRFRHLLQQTGAEVHTCAPARRRIFQRRGAVLRRHGTAVGLATDGATTRVYDVSSCHKLADSGLRAIKPL